jgi:hypothetical protein
MEGGTMTKRTILMHCKRPDRDVPRARDGTIIECGYPLPCPWHTAIVDVPARRITNPTGSPLVGKRLGAILDAVADGEPSKHAKGRR